MMKLRQRRSAWCAGAAAAFLGFSAPTAAIAFDPHGHEVIEAVTYRWLLETDARFDDGTGNKASGKEVLGFLIAQGVLEKPECFNCGDEGLDKPFLSWPVIGSGKPDLVMSRQFSSNGQCFHFMARAADVWGSEPETEATPHRLDVPRSLATDAYARCTRMMTSLLNGILSAPEESNRDYRGVYALMHIIVDSFSDAHVSRDKHNRIEYLKPWRLRAWTSYSIHWSGWKYFGGDSHHGVFDDRDDQYVLDDAACPGTGHPYSMPRSCLTDRALAASQALEDLLLLLYRVTKKIATERAAEPIRYYLGYEWAHYLNEHFQSMHSWSDSRPPAKIDREWRPIGSLGVRFRPNPVPGANDLTATLGFMDFNGLSFPFVYAPEIEAGIRRKDSRSNVLLSTNISLSLPILDNVLIGVTAFSLELDAPDLKNPRIGANIPRVDLYLFDALHLSLSGPRFSWESQKFEGEPFTIGIATAFGKTVPNYNDSGSPTRFGEQRFGRDAKRWHLRPLNDDFQTSPYSFILTLVGGNVLPVDNESTFLTPALEVSRDRDRINRRSGLGGSGLGVGARLGGVRHKASNYDEFGVALGTPLRYYIIPDFLALVMSPIEAELTHRVHEKENGSGLRFDIGVEAGAAITLLNSLEVGLFSPRFSYVHLDRVKGTNLGVRFALVLPESW
ncbi:hypothetical protein [Sorangium sp. So ce385]|uniref:hypothetical protein n=1 Tax=Sorangium sp. So ce385 TaxID=3133308 RepID=UPI003F5AF8AA